MTIPLLEIQNLTKYYPIKRGLFHSTRFLKAVDGVTFAVKEGEIVSLVGESGCGKSTLAKQILRIEEPSSGNIRFEEKEILEWKGFQKKKYWKKIQLIFQDPYSSLNPRWKIGKIIGEPLAINSDLSKSMIQKKVIYLMEKVGLSSEHLHRYAHQFSGGQRQRIGIARALALEPKMLICDEPVSALDVSVQSQVLNLLLDLQEGEEPLTYLFISHDLGVVHHISDRVLVMYLGKIVESAPTDQIFENPRHPYTQALLNAIPQIGKKLDPKNILRGDMASPLSPPPGCSFRSRCPIAQDSCANISMELVEQEENHWSSCLFLNQ